jgi:sugar/nucleoside kinase (ribokinase family)
MVQKRAEVVVAGHICLDIIPDIGEHTKGMDAILVPGKLINIGPAVTATGGAVSNTGIALHKLGMSTSLMGKVGDDLFGRAILDMLNRHSSRLSEGMIVADGEHSSYTVVVSPPGVDRVFLHCTGANDTFQAADVKYDELAGSRLFHFGYPPLMRRMYADGGQEITDLFARVKETGLTTALDMAKPDPESAAGHADWQALLARLLPNVDVFLPSLDEILYMLDRRRYNSFVEETASGDLLTKADGPLLSELSGRLLDMGVAVAVIKLGDQGLYLRTTNDPERLKSIGASLPANWQRWVGRELIAPCFQVDVAGTTGAGDCTIAGFHAGLLQGLPPEETMTAAVAVGACNVEKADATSGVPSWSAVLQRIASGWPRRETRLSLPGWRWESLSRLWIGPHDHGVK